MKQNYQFPATIIVATIICATASHLLSAWVDVGAENEAQRFTVGDPTEPLAYLAGSSLANYAVAWQEVSESQKLHLHTWGIGGSSPFEWEQFQEKLPNATATYLVVSAYDLDEAMICDFRAEFAPIGKSVRALIQADVGRDYAKRTLSQYPVKWLRTLFPTLGRARKTMGRVREKVKSLVTQSELKSNEKEGLKLDFSTQDETDDYRKKRISDWSEGETANKIAGMRTSFAVSHGFNGVKRNAFHRMLEFGIQRGRVIVLVLPVSNTYTAAILSPDALDQFDDSLAKTAAAVPDAEWLRLDQDSKLAADKYFCDLVHMNYDGLDLVTNALIDWLEHSEHRQ
jgi:hypothetical protein